MHLLNCLNLDNDKNYFYFFIFCMPNFNRFGIISIQHNLNNYCVELTFIDNPWTLCLGWKTLKGPFPQPREGTEIWCTFSENKIDLTELIFPRILINISLLTYMSNNLGGLFIWIPAVWFWLTRHFICIHKLISTIWIEINDLCHRAWFWCYNQEASDWAQGSFVAEEKLFWAWQRAKCLMDNHVPFQKYVRLVWAKLLWYYTWHAVCVSATSARQKYVLSHSHSNRNKAFDRGGKGTL